MIIRRLISSSKTTIQNNFTNTSKLNKNNPFQSNQPFQIIKSFKQYSSTNTNIKQLNKLLNQEIEHENNNYKGISDTDHINFLNETGFVFEESEAKSLMILKRIKDKYTTTIYFHSR